MPFVPDPQPQEQPAAPVARSRFMPDAPKKPYDPMNDAPRLPGEEGYVAPGKPKESSVVDDTLNYAGDYLGGVGDALTAPLPEAPGKKGGFLDRVVASLGDVPILGDLYGAAESATTLASSAVAPALASLKGAVTGTEPTNADIEGFTYSPRTSQGAGINRVAGAVAKPVADVAEATGADAALLPLAPELGGVKAPPRAPKAPKPAPNMSEPATAARAAGFKLLPSEGGGGKIAQAAESLMGPGGKKDFRRDNAAAATKLAKEEIGAESLDEKGIAKVRDEGNAAYSAMEGIGQIAPDDALIGAVNGLKPKQGIRTNADIAGLQEQFAALLDPKTKLDAKEVVYEVRQLRKEATANSSPPALGAKPDPKKQSLAKAQTDLANALDDWLERNATAMGSPEVAQEYRAARQRLAKTASVERATSGGKTDVRNLEKQDERGVPHTGRLKVASQTSEYFPESTGAAAGPEVNITPDTLFGTARQMLQNVLLRPAISRILRSDFYQNRFGQAVGDTGPEGPLGGYFSRQQAEAPSGPAPAPRDPNGVDFTRSAGNPEAMRVANTLAGDLELEPEGPAPNLPPAPDRLTADVPPPVRGDVPFTPSNLVQDLGLEFAEAPQGSLPGGQAPRAAGLAGDLGLFEEPSLAPEPFNGPLTLEGGPSMVNLNDVLRLVENEAAYDGQFQPGAPRAPRAASPGAPDTGGLSLVPEEPPVTIEDFMDYQAGNPTPGQFGKMQAAGYVTGDAVSSRLTPEGARARRALAGEAEPEPMAMQQQQSLGDAFSVQPSLRPGYSILRGQGDAGMEMTNATLGELFGDLEAPVTPIGDAGASRLRTAQEYEAGGGFQEKPAVKGAPEPKQKPKFETERNDETGEVTLSTKDGGLVLRPRGGFLRINYAQVKPGQRGKGKGLELYEEAIRQAESQGLQLASDIKVSKDAARVYDALERRGYKITRNDADVDPETGELTSQNSGKPVFVVESKSAE